jgi:hypothetical protein
MRSVTFSSDPQVSFVSQILDEINSGSIQIPRFQRPLVWQWDQQLELLRSIRDGIPMGAIMIWRTSETEIQTFGTLGPHHLRQPERAGGRQYLLDGVQRLSTLYNALYPATSHSASDEDSEVNAEAVYYDLDEKDFVQLAAEPPRSNLLPLNILFDSVALLRFQRFFPEDRADRWVEASDEVARAFRTYKVPIIPITTDDIDLATRTFQKINSQGETMSEAHMLQALTWSNTFDLREQLSELKGTILSPIGWGSLGDDEILKVCKAAFELDVYETKADALSKRLRKEPEQLANAVRSISRVANFLGERCYVPSPVFVPYSLQITILAETFRITPNPSPELENLLEAWFWASTYGELFRGMSGYRLQRTISDMRSMVSDGQFRWSGHKAFDRQPLRAYFDFRSARSKALTLLLIGAASKSDASRDVQHLLRSIGRDGVLQFIGPSTIRSKALLSPANRILARPEDLPSIRQELIEDGASPRTLSRLFISEDAAIALRNRDAGRFLVTRFADMEHYESEFLDNKLKEIS